MHVDHYFHLRYSLTLSGSFCNYRFRWSLKIVAALHHCMFPNGWVILEAVNRASSLHLHQHLQRTPEDQVWSPHCSQTGHQGRSQLSCLDSKLTYVRATNNPAFNAGLWCTETSILGRTRLPAVTGRYQSV
jgi:hypothetical protein